MKDNLPSVEERIDPETDLLTEEEFFYRSAPPDAWNKNLNRYESSVFKQSVGVSGEIGFGRSDKECVDSLKGYRSPVGVVFRVKNPDINELGVYCFKDPAGGNEYHGLLLRENLSTKFSKSMPRRLLSSAEKVFEDR